MTNAGQSLTGNRPVDVLCEESSRRAEPVQVSVECCTVTVRGCEACPGLEVYGERGVGW